MKSFFSFPIVSCANTTVLKIRNVFLIQFQEDMFDLEHEETKFNLRRQKAMSLGAGLNKIHLQQQNNFDEPDGDFPAQEQFSFLHSKCKFHQNQYLMEKFL